MVMLVQIGGGTIGPTLSITVSSSDRAESSLAAFPIHIFL